jgi:hypothetical protein
MQIMFIKSTWNRKDVLKLKKVVRILILKHFCVYLPACLVHLEAQEPQSTGLK